MQDILLNLVPGAFSPEVHLSQYDKGRVIPFKLVDDKSAYSVPEGAIVKVKATKPSGLGFVVNCTANGDRVTIENTETMSNEFGRFPAELSITDGGVLLGTANFVFNVERSPHPEGTTDGDSDSLIPELTLLVERIENSNARIESMTASATPLPSGQNPTANYNKTTNTLELGIPVADRQYITVDGVDYPITSITKTTRVNISGVEVAYGEGQTLFIPDGYGMAGVEEFLQSQIDEKVSDIKVNGVTQDKDASGVVNLTISDDTKADAIVKSASGSIASFSDGGDDMPMKSLKVNIAPKQSGSGDASPSNIRPISGWDEVDVTRSGKNLFDSHLNSGLIGLNVGNDDTTVTASSRYGYSDKIDASKPLTIMFKSNDVTRFDYICVMRYVNGIATENLINTTVSASLVQGGTISGVEGSYIRIIAGADGSHAVGDTVSGDVQVELGTSMTDYEPYEGETITTNLPQTVYGGNVDIIEGKGQPTYWYKAMTGGESALQELGDYYGWVDGTQFPYCKESSPQYGRCSHFRYGIDTLVGVNASSGAYFLIKKSAMPNISSLSEFRDWVIQQHNNGTPLTIAYELATPTASEFTTTPTEVKTKLGANNIWSESGTVDVEYRADTTLAYNELLSIIANM